MTGYTKLFGSIVASTIWRESHEIRIVWITMLAMADKNGIVGASIPGLADLARVTLPECLDAIKALQEPDPYSRTPDFEGRRIEVVDGGWRILNHAKYRSKMGVDERREYLREKQQEARDKKKARQQPSTTEDPKSTRSTHADAQSQSKPDPEASTKEDPLPKTDEAKRIATMFGRRLSTAWGGGEIKAFKALMKTKSITPESLDLLEAYYTRERAKGDQGKHRRDLSTFLNNFPGELDRATSSASPVPAKPPEASPPDWDLFARTSPIHCEYAGNWKSAPQFMKQDFQTWLTQRKA